MSALTTTNQILAALPAKTQKRLLPKLKRFDLIFSETVYDKGDLFSHVYFPESGIISLLASVDEHSTIEVAMVGCEGMVALPVFLGIEHSANRAVVQGSGVALRLTVADMLAECAASDDLPRIMRLFTYSLLMQIARSAVCNRFHPIESRLARWLLMTQDRMKSPDFRITQEFLSYMLGVRREAVNKAATGFQRRHLISYARGNMSLIDRPALEKIACNCYGFIAGNS
ncbi:MAG: Crp/Fnr family transcriptional regulator [Chloracidobacterium sp.]|nr:Crp/Fnr family transcriptional regulator [Chloracidobacterium sp.]